MCGVCVTVTGARASLVRCGRGLPAEIKVCVWRSHSQAVTYTLRLRNRRVCLSLTLFFYLCLCPLCSYNAAVRLVHDPRVPRSPQE